jgi:hypothetical protein
MGIALLVLACAVEAYWIVTVNIRIPQDTGPGALPNQNVYMVLSFFRVFQMI